MYDLHRLGWSSFQDLCLTITREILGQTVQSFLSSSDGGRDGAFAGIWENAKHESLSGPFVIQCKYTSQANKSLTLSDVKEELSKAESLVKDGLCETYILMTNAGLSGVMEARLKREFSVVGVTHFVALGSDWICQQIRDSKRLRTLVPRVYGLGDLTQILDDRAYDQAIAVLESMREDLAKVVITDAYRKAVDALNKFNIVFLVGEPAAGKSTIASLLAMAAIDQWGGSVVKAEKPSEVMDHWNPQETSQFFWVDDAFGVTQYESFRASEWNRVFPQINALLQRGAKMVMTSRDYIFNRAHNDLKVAAFPRLLESQVVINVEDLKEDERRKVLYNHLKMGRQPRAFLTSIKPHLEDVALHPRFSPEAARRLADPFFTQGLWVSATRLEEFVEKREQLLREVILGLDTGSRAALGLIYIHKGSLNSPIDLGVSETDALHRLGGSLADIIPALEALDGSLVSLRRSPDGLHWEFRHPTIGDAYADVLARGPEYIEVFLRGSSIEVIFSQVTCGDVGLERALVVPRALFPLMLEYLQAYRDQEPSVHRRYQGYRRRRYYDFLSKRCSREFLQQYLSSNPEWFEDVSNPGLMLNAVPEVPFAVRLQALKLLPEQARRGFVETVSEYVVQGDDAGPLGNREIASLFKPAELEALVKNVGTSLVPRLGEVREDWQRDSRGQDDVSAFFDNFLDILDALEETLVADVEALAAIAEERDNALEWLTENVSAEGGSPESILESIEETVSINSERSIFDDIDA